MFGNSIMKNKRDYLSEDEVTTMLKVALEHFPPRYYLIIRVLARTGRRIREVIGHKPYERYVGLRPIDFHDNYLVEWDICKKDHVKKVYKGKKRTEQQLEILQFSKKPRRVLKYMDVDTYDYLQAYIKANDILPYQRVFPFTRMWALRVVKDVAKYAKIPRWREIHPHMFRHSFAIHYLKTNKHNSNAIRLLQQILEHENADMTMHYLQFLPEDQQEGIECMYDDT